MFIGHWAPALAAAAVSPRAPKLGTLFIAGQLVDWAFFAFAIVGIEQMRITPGITQMNPLDLYHMPYTHSLVGSLVWAAGFAAIIWFATRDRTAASIGGGVVFSHWLLDLLVHAPDLTIAGGDEKYGFGLWDHPAIEMPLEIGITFGALYWYSKATRGPIVPIATLAVVLALVQAINWFGPHPEVASAGMFIQALFAFGVITLIAWWVGKTRVHKRAQG